jgi:hypothetical protein|tara:strand:+ start:39 stop:392 length:354 start_codon:yes stop_codon:yes gene_type:complete
MDKREITEKIEILLKMLYTEGQIQGLNRSKEMISGETSETESVGSDPHPTLPPIKPWNAKSFTISINEENDTVEFKVDGELRNKHTSKAAAIKFEQLLMHVKDQLASWNATKPDWQN